MKSKLTAAKRGYAIELQADEIVPRGRAITCTADAAIHPDAWRGITVVGQRAPVRAGEDNRQAHVETSGLSPGSYVLRIGELWNKRSGARLAGMDMPFMVVDTAAPLPTELAVQHAVRLRFDELSVARSRLLGACEADWVEVFKAEHRSTRKPVELAFDAKGRPFDIAKARVELARRRLKTFGKVHPDLHEHLRHESNQARDVEVAVWLATPEVPLPEKPSKGMLRRRPSAQSRQREAMKATTARFEEGAASFGLQVTRVDPAAPVVFGTVSAARVAALAEAKEVAAIFLHRRGGIDDLGNSIAIANADDAHTAGLNGSGIDVAVYERGPDVTTDLDIEDRFDNTPATSQHSRHTHGIIKNTERNRPHGHAPDCNLYSANSYDLDALRWAVDDIGCTVISQSFHRDDEQTSTSAVSLPARARTARSTWPETCGSTPPTFGIRIRRTAGIRSVAAATLTT